MNPRSLPEGLTNPITLEESPLPHVMKGSVAVIALLVSVFLGWAALTPVEEIATASGQTVPSGYIQSVQYVDGGVVREILVADGDLVEAGQPLLRFDDTNARADLGQMKARQTSLRLQAERLRRFVGQESQGAVLTEEETAILVSMEEARAGQQRVLRDQIAQKEQERHALSSNRIALAKNLTLMGRENAIRQNLASKGYGSQLMALNSERDLNQMQGKMEENSDQNRRADEALREARNRLTSLGADLKQEAMKNLGQNEAELMELKQSLEKLEHTASRTVIDSPVRGIVKGLSVHTIGAVVEPGKLLMEVVPVGETLLVEASVSPSDVGHMTAGQPVRVKVTAFDYTRYGAVSGHLLGVSASTFQTEKGESYYKARIGLDRHYVGPESAMNLILPGMVVQADIVIGKKSVLQYLLKPIQHAVSGAFHER